MQINSQAKGPYPDELWKDKNTDEATSKEGNLSGKKTEMHSFLCVFFCWQRKGTDMELKTPLYETHLKVKGKMVPFAGYLMPVQYEHGILAEHKAVRECCGLFDVSHMGEILCKGKDALKSINHLLTNDYTDMESGTCRYSPMCNEQGGVVDDLIVYKLDDETYYIVVNASNKDKDFAWMKAHLMGDTEFTDLSDGIAQLALQGPKAADILSRLCLSLPEKYYTFIKETEIDGIKALVSRTGYTGEDGFEIYLANDDVISLWEKLLDAGKDDGLIPCGLGARDTLRLEAAMPLYGHEMNDEITPLETNLKFAVKLNKDDFIGKEALMAQDVKRTRIGLKVTGRGIVREHMPVYVNGLQIGITTSGTQSPTLNIPIAMALIDKEYKEIGTKLEVEVRGRRIEAEIVRLPFYKKQQ